MTAFLSPTVILPPPRKTIPRQSTLHVLHPWERKRADNLIPGSVPPHLSCMVFNHPKMVFKF